MCGVPEKLTQRERLKAYGGCPDHKSPIVHSIPFYRAPLCAGGLLGGQYTGVTMELQVWEDKYIRRQPQYARCFKEASCANNNNTSHHGPVGWVLILCEALFWGPTCLTLHNPYNKPGRHVIISFPFHRSEKKWVSWNKMVCLTEKARKPRLGFTAQLSYLKALLQTATEHCLLLGV